MPMDQCILKIFFPRFRIQSKILMDLQLLQLRWIKDSSIFSFLGLDFGLCVFLLGFWIKEQNFNGAFG